MHHPLRPVVCVLVLESRCVIAELRTRNGELVTTAQGTTYGDTSQKAEAYAYAMGAEIVEWR